MQGNIQRFQGLGYGHLWRLCLPYYVKAYSSKWHFSNHFLTVVMLSWLSLHHDENMFDEAIRQNDHEAYRDGRQRISLLCASFPTKEGYRLTTQGYICAGTSLQVVHCTTPEDTLKLFSAQNSQVYTEFVYTSSYWSWLNWILWKYLL